MGDYECPKCGAKLKEWFSEHGCVEWLLWQRENFIKERLDLMQDIQNKTQEINKFERPSTSDLEAAQRYKDAFLKGLRVGSGMERTLMDKEEHAFLEVYELWLEQRRENKQLEANLRTQEAKLNPNRTEGQIRVAIEVGFAQAVNYLCRAWTKEFVIQDIDEYRKEIDEAVARYVKVTPQAELDVQSHRAKNDSTKERSE